MAQLIIRTEKIKDNIKKLSAYFKENEVKWSLITKVFSGDKEFLKNLLTPDVVENIQSVGDSRLTSLRNLKELNPNLQTIYIKPPANIYAKEIVKYADISLNTSFSTIQSLNEAAQKAGKTHKIIIMIDLGELREGVNRSDLMHFYEKVFQLQNIEVIGLGSNLGCLYGIEPTYDKLLQLTLYKELIAERFNKNLEFISGGSSITLPLLEDKMIPKEINHFRIGEAAFFGTSPLKGKKFLELNTNTFEFQANIIELEQKRIIPDGIISSAGIGNIAKLDESKIKHKTYKAILDFGLLDVERSDIEFCGNQGNMKFVGITSDMIVIDLQENENQAGKKHHKVGDKICFQPNYMGVARLLNSKFIDKVFE